MRSVHIGLGLLFLILSLVGCRRDDASNTNEEKTAHAAPSVVYSNDIPSGPEDRFSWNQRTTIRAYERIGNRNPQWDAPARNALTAFADMRGSRLTPEEAQKIIADNCRRAIAANCDDPLIGYLYARFVMGYIDILPEDYCASLARAADRLRRSQYPEARKFFASIRAAEQLNAMATSASNASPSMYIHRRMAIMSLSNVVRDKSVPIEELDEMCSSMLQQTLRNSHQLEEWYSAIEQPLFANWGNRYQPWLLKGLYYVKHAWNARGDGFANKVTDEGWKLFKERLEMAGQALKTAWTLDTNDVRVPNEMLTVELGEGQGRKRMDYWFGRAMALDTNNYEACSRKLYYLEPKWYGSSEMMLAFGRECASSTNWGGRVPLILVDAHDNLAAYMKRDKGDDRDYWKDPKVWSEVKQAYERFFQLEPQAARWRHNYARHAWKSEQWDDLNRQIPLLGKINYDYFGGKSEFDRMVATAKEHARN